MTAVDLDAVYRNESRHVKATLLRLLGDLDAAEEGLHEAFLAAAEKWPREGLPRNPRAWLISAGRFQAIDAMRKRARYDAFLERFPPEMAEELGAELDYIPDDDLRLIFLCSHPDLAPDARIALTLREACGLTTEEIAQAFLVKPSAIAQRIVRAKARIREAGIAVELPSRSELPERLGAVLHVIYLLFNEGYEPTYGPSLTRVDLCAEAIRLAYLVVDILPEPEVYGLLALMTFHHARMGTRTSPTGELVPLESQDRSRWNREEIARAQTFLKRALLLGQMGRFTCEGSIAALHAEAPSAQDTNWQLIVQLYNALLTTDPSPIVRLNRAVAIAMRDGPAAGLTIINEILAEGSLAEYRFAHAARADMYRRLGRNEQARSAYETALSMTRQDVERRFLLGRLSEVTGSG